LVLRKRVFVVPLPVDESISIQEESPLRGVDRSLFIAMGILALCSLCSTLGLLSIAIKSDRSTPRRGLSSWNSQRWAIESSPPSAYSRSLFIAMGILALCSLCSTLGLLSFLTYRFIYWQPSKGTLLLELPAVGDRVLAAISV
jgi:hypothetical protein